MIYLGETRGGREGEGSSRIKMDSFSNPHPKYKCEMLLTPTPLEGPVLSLLWALGCLGSIVCIGQQSGERGWSANSSRQWAEDAAEGMKCSWTTSGQLPESPGAGDEDNSLDASRVNYFLKVQFYLFIYFYLLFIFNFIIV